MQQSPKKSGASFGQGPTRSEGLAAARKPAERMPVAGIHLSGSNAAKTAIVILSGTLLERSLHIDKVYEKISSFGTLFSDERLISILTQEGPLAAAFVDCPLTLPPCVACVRPTCPGVTHCEDTDVAFMLRLAANLKQAGKKYRDRPINPQHHRLWDVNAILHQQKRLEPSYSANQAPLVARARTLQRRIAGAALLEKSGIPLKVKETAVPLALAAMSELIGISETQLSLYRNFEKGRQIRQDCLAALVEKGVLYGDASTLPSQLRSMALSVELFQATITAIVAGMDAMGATQAPPEFMGQEARDATGWVVLPDHSSMLETT